MISRAMPPIDLGFSVGWEEAGQAVAFTYLAYYNSEPMQARVTLTYQRAWGCDTIILFPRVPGVTPGFVVGLWTSSPLKRMVIAIEGTTSSAQILSLTSLTGWTSRVGILGYVYAFMKTQADAIYAQLLAHATTGPKMTDGRWCITWTGHSLGAACADINAVRHKAENPSVNVRLIKFGSPQVGNSSYVESAQSNLPKTCFYVGKDPIHNFPSARILAALSSAVTFGLDQGGAKDQVVNTLDWNSGDAIVGYTPEDWTQTTLDYARYATLPYEVGTHWYDHLIGSYRMAFVARAARTRDNFFYRMCYLEHNDENVWQRDFEQVRYWRLMQSIDVVEPTPADPPSAQVDAFLNTVANVGGGGGDWGQDSVPQTPLTGQPPVVLDEGGGGVAWGIQVPRLRARSLRGRRPTPTTPAP